ncbi:MAG: DUF2730 family protein [Sphingomonas sp.]
MQAPSKRNEQAFAKFRDVTFGEFKKDVAEDFERVNRGVDGLKERLSVTEAVIKEMPDKESVHRLELKVSDLSGTLGIVGQKVESVDRTARRVEEFLLEQAKK